MASSLRHPETHMPIADLQQYKRVVRQTAGLPAYDMDDPERPFTAEYDVSLRDPVSEAQPTEGPLPEESTPESIATEALKAQVDRIADIARNAGDQATSAAMDSREDAWESLGGGQASLFDKKSIPVGLTEDITETTTHGRGGKLVTRLELNGKFLDIPVEEGQPHAPKIEEAKTRLLQGRGKSTRTLSRKRTTSTR